MMMTARRGEWDKKNANEHVRKLLWWCMVVMLVAVVAVVVVALVIVVVVGWWWWWLWWCCDCDVGGGSNSDDHNDNVLRLLSTLWRYLQRLDGMGRQRPQAKDYDPERWLRYRPPVQSGVSDQLGKRFEIERSHLNWKIDDMDFVSLTPEIVRQFVVATAASSSFYYYSLEAISTVQKHLPNHTIFFYDLDPRKKNPVARKVNANVDVILQRSYTTL